MPKVYIPKCCATVYSARNRDNLSVRLPKVSTHKSVEMWKELCWKHLGIDGGTLVFFYGTELWHPPDIVIKLEILQL